MTKLDSLSPEDLTFIEECDVFLRREADQFVGSMKPKACVFGEGDERRYSKHRLVISESKYWRDDATYLVSDDSFFKGTKPGEPSEMRRALIYWCDVHFYDGETEPQVTKGLRVHNQGGSASATRPSDGQVFDLLIRAKEYPYYASRPDFIYYSLRRSGEERSVSFGIADPDSRQFGLNNGSMSVFCHRDGYDFREPVEAL